MPNTPEGSTQNSRIIRVRDVSVCFEYEHNH
jgi:hypothetical protein